MTSRTSSRHGTGEARFPRSRAGAGLAAVVLVAALTPSSLAASAATPLLPDLVADPPGDAAAPKVYTDTSSGTSSLLMRFNGYVRNRGQGALEMRGTNPVGGEMTTVQQRIYDSEGGFADAGHLPPAVIRYEPADGHNHWHLRHAAGYSLWNAERTAQVGAANKVGFCLVDSAHVDPFGPATKVYTTSNTGFCRQNSPGAQDVVMGVSSGWRDVYSWALSYQWVDISDVAPGRYWLRSTVDPDDVITESDENNPAAFGANQAIVNGYAANSFSKRVGNLSQTQIPLSFSKYDDPSTVNPGPLEFRITRAPSRGVLNQPTGVWFSATSVTYTPLVVLPGQDSFEFEARDANSQFPRTPVRATAALGVGTAPASAPAARQPIKTASRTAPAPDVRTAVPAAGRSAIGRPVAEQHGPWVLVSAAAGRAGVVLMTAEADGLRLGSCTARVPAGATATCRFDLPSAAGHHHGGSTAEDHHHGGGTAEDLHATVSHTSGSDRTVRSTS